MRGWCLDAVGITGTSDRVGMSAIEQLNRTLLVCRDYVSDELSDASICRRLQSVSVLCVADVANLSSHSGQSCLTTVVSLLSRMGMQVILGIPEISMLRRQPPFASTLLRDSLLASSGRLIADATVQEASWKRKPDLIFVLGDTAIEEWPCPIWRLSGSEWVGLITQGAARVSRWTTEWPIGAMTSAVLAASEAFKYAMQRMPFRDPADRIFVVVSEACAWDFGSVRVPKGDLDVGPLDIISAGAVTQAALFALLRIPNLRMIGRVFDDDATAATNSNRNMLTMLADVGIGKAQLAADRCQPHFRLVPISHRFSAGTGELAPHVLVGVDDIPSRWEVQKQTEGIVVVSGTSHFNISSSEHGPGSPCCGCLHPMDDPGTNLLPTISFVSFWAGLAMVVRLLRQALGFPYPPEHQHLWLSPLRMDLPNAGVWSPVAAREDCPVRCPAALSNPTS